LQEFPLKEWPTELHAKGYNAIAVDRALLNTTGILYYTVKAGNDAATLKMIQVD
jgi:hypothetical protein